jgi:glycosyltransferase involved in cell wall biosynthesis
VTPEVSVVVPTWNRAHLLEESLASLFAQEGVSFEVVVVDDGSTDGTAALLGAMSDPRVRVIEAPHEGISRARNRGVDAARAAMIAFHDSDDVALPGRLATPARYLREHPHVDVVIQNGVLLAAGDAGPGTPWVRPEVAGSLVGRAVGVGDVFRWNLGQLQGTCFTRRCLDAVGRFDPAWDVLEDLDLMLRVTVRFRAAFLDVPAFRYQRHGDGASADRLHLRETSIRVADALMARHPEALAAVGSATFRRRQARRWAKLAAMRRAAGDVGGARAAIAGACRLAPGHVGYRLRALELRVRAR